MSLLLLFGQFEGAPVAPYLPDPDRTFLIAADNRSHLVAAEARVFYVLADPRTFTVPDELRTT